ncbi:molybdopterin dinucleotide binding domain-containing protein [Aquamicrobium zhengzhouense]|uniref:molybdopterin dinucleotide binding domain-containing protein n=1 Tax=Aquamicrobium zhengzhouense TaxID=2781738 RepID=UPI001F4382F7|nr:molybdopterin dinucleotide binding domain-containing protein [Aquamicrobium zhengzhouense]
MRDSLALARQPSLRNSVLAGLQSALAAAIVLPLIHLSPWSHLIGLAALERWWRCSVVLRPSAGARASCCCVPIADRHGVRHVRASRGKYKPASPHLCSEPRIVTKIAKASLLPNGRVPWDEWVGDYALVRDEIAAIFPADFRNFNARLDIPGGFARPVPARDRRWETDTGRANFKVPQALNASFDEGNDPDILRLITLRSNDQFNTTVYGYDDRLRGIHGSRMIVMMNRKDRERLGIEKDGTARLTTAVDDGINRSMGGFQVIDYDLPSGTIAAYYPECNALIPLWHYSQESKTPAAKSVPVRIAVERQR